MLSDILRKYINITQEYITEGIEEKYRGLTIKAYIRKDKGIAVANVFNNKGVVDTKLFPQILAASEQEALDLQKQAIDNLYIQKNAGENTKSFTKVYPNPLLQKYLGLGSPIYTKVGNNKSVYISRNPKEGFKRSMKYADGTGFGAPIHKTDIEGAGLELGTRYSVTQFDTGDPDVIGLKCQEHSKILSSNDKDPGNTPLIVIQWAGRNKAGE